MNKLVLISINFRFSNFLHIYGIHFKLHNIVSTKKLCLKNIKNFTDVKFFYFISIFPFHFQQNRMESD